MRTAWTEYLQPGDEANNLLKEGVCDECFRPAKEWAQKDQHGGIEVFGKYDSHGNLIGFVCPDCMFPACSIPGMYPLYYFDEEGNVLCPNARRSTLTKCKRMKGESRWPA
ncbi:hypothetical protein kuro4_00420 [Gelria sp. Kuro-4]|nr:hypothetical protein kuro4_00420 [Gelria sp. Kuro-4]